MALEIDPLKYDALPAIVAKLELNDWLAHEADGEYPPPAALRAYDAVIAYDDDSD